MIIFKLCADLKPNKKEKLFECEPKVKKRKKRKPYLDFFLHFPNRHFIIKDLLFSQESVKNYLIYLQMAPLSIFSQIKHPVSVQTVYVSI